MIIRWSNYYKQNTTKYYAGVSLFSGTPFFGVTAVTPFVAYLPYLNVKLAGDFMPVFLPDISALEQTVYTYDERITEDGETRLTEDGETRILDGFDINSHPEVVTVKLPNNIVNVSLP